MQIRWLSLVVLAGCGSDAARPSLWETEARGYLRQQGRYPDSVELVARNPTGTVREVTIQLHDTCSSTDLFLGIEDARGAPLYDGDRTCDALTFAVPAGSFLTVRVAGFRSTYYRVTLAVR